MNCRTHLILVLALAVVACLVAHAIEAQAPAPPKPGPEMQRIDWLVGTWTYTEKYEPSIFGPAGEGKGTMTVKLGPGGLSHIIDFKTVGSHGTAIGHEIWTWSPREKKYVAFAVGNEFAGPLRFSGNWEGEELAMTGTLDLGETQHEFRTVWKEIKSTSVKYVILFGPPGGEKKLVASGVATKK